MSVQKDEQQQKWHVGKEVPIALVVALVLQTFGVVWGAASLNASVVSHEKADLREFSGQKEVDRRQDDEAIRSEERVLKQLVKLESKLDGIQTLVSRNK